jgi:hypothetical protein
MVVCLDCGEMLAEFDGFPVITGTSVSLDINDVGYLYI